MFYLLSNKLLSNKYFSSDYKFTMILISSIFRKVANSIVNIFKVNLKHDDMINVLYTWINMCENLLHCKK